MNHPLRIALFTTAATGLVAGLGGAATAGELNLLTWEGYAPESITVPFEAATGCKVTASYVGSNDDFAPKMAAGGGVYDIITPAQDVAPIMSAAGFVLPIDTARIEGYAGIYPEFASNAALNSGGTVWGVPMTWGSISLIYRPDKVEGTPDSVAILFDPAYAGKIAMWDDKSAIYWTARLLGYDDIYNLTDEQLEEIKAKLIAQKPLVRKYWTSAGELTELMANQEAYVSNAWTGLTSKDVNALNKGFTVKDFSPKEKSEGWMDSMMLVKDSPNEECAYKWMSFIQSPQGQCGLVEATGYFPVNPGAVAECLSDERKTDLQVGNSEFVKSLVMWELPARLDKYIEVWNAVKAAP